MQKFQKFANKVMILSKVASPTNKKDPEQEKKEQEIMRIEDANVGSFGKTGHRKSRHGEVIKPINLDNFEKTF